MWSVLGKFSVILQGFTVKGNQNTGKCDAALNCSARFGLETHMARVLSQFWWKLHSWAYIQPANEDSWEKVASHTKPPDRQNKALPTFSSPKLPLTHFLCSTEGPLIRVICVSHHLVSLRTHWSLADSSLQLASCFCFWCYVLSGLSQTEVTS